MKSLVRRCSPLDLAVRLAGLAVVLAPTGMPGVTRAQLLGTGGVIGTTTGGALTDADIYVSFQRTQDENLTDLDRSLFLNKANCECSSIVWVKAVILPSASVRAAAVPSSASVSMYVGNACDPTVSTSCCHRLATVPFSEFRLSGITAQTTVDQLVRQWTVTSGSCQNTIGPATLPSDYVPVVGTGGTSGTGGAGTGGAGGAGGDTGSTGGTTGLDDTTVHGACYNNTFTQALNLFIGTEGDGSHDLVTKNLGFSVDTLPPDPPSDIVVAPVNEALQVSWTGIATSDASDILGYQALCSRGLSTPVFKTGTFTATFDSCPTSMGAGWPPVDTVLGEGAYVCSDVIPTSSSSARIKILENGVTYLVGIAAVDRQRNASLVTPQQGTPILTKDFYYEYRHGDPQGASPGGFCEIPPTASGGLTAIGMGAIAAGLTGMLAWAGWRSRKRRRR